MYKDMIQLANTALKATKVKFNDDDKHFVAFFAYKTGDMKQMQVLIKEMQAADTPEDMENIKTRYKEQMNITGGIEQVAEELLVCIERYRLEQENAIGYLAATLNLNGIKISDEEIRNTDMMELKDKRPTGYVAIYIGNGKVVEAKNESAGVVYGDLTNTEHIVLIGRPQ